jgi:dUTP pyrophosphatase
MRVKIKRFDTSIPAPAYQTNGAVCVDMRARLETVIEPKSIGYIPLNVALEIPEGYWAMLAPRSSTHKMGLMCGNSIGIFDWDFRGDNDEYHFIVFNFTDKPVTVEKGQRIAQLMVMKVERIEFEEVAALEGADRGKIGSTGQH